jgi:HAMP domain-containing protein
MRTLVLILIAVLLLNSAAFANRSEAGDTIPAADVHHDMSNMNMNDTVPHDDMHHDMNNMQVNDTLPADAPSDE